MDKRNEKYDDELLSSFALDALSDAERQEVLRRMSASSATRDEVDALQEVAARLGLGVPAVKPPARLKADIMATIRNTPQNPRTEPVEEESNLVDQKATATNGARTGQKFFALAAGVLLVAAAGLGIVAWNLANQQEDLKSQVAAVTSERDTMMKMFSAPDMQSKAQEMSGGATVRLSYSVSAGVMAVTTSGMPDLPQDKGYELWLISKDGAKPAGMLNSTSEAATKMITGPMSGVTHVGITVEPAAGSETPTSDPIVLQQL